MIVSSVTVSEVDGATKRLKNKITSGPKLIPSFLIRYCRVIVLELLCRLLDASEFPEVWKVSKVTPVYKSGDPNGIANSL